jgi:tRNA(fMet)-specific endonuclease VapC
MTYLLDTNIVSYILKRNINLENKLQGVTSVGEGVFISCITYYEIKRGLVAINAVRQLADFDIFIRRYEVLFLDDMEIIEQATQYIYLTLEPMWQQDTRKY